MFVLIHLLYLFLLYFTYVSIIVVWFQATFQISSIKLRSVIHLYNKVSINWCRGGYVYLIFYNFKHCDFSKRFNRWNKCKWVYFLWFFCYIYLVLLLMFSYQWTCYRFLWSVYISSILSYFHCCTLTFIIYLLIRHGGGWWKILE